MAFCLGLLKAQQPVRVIDIPKREVFNIAPSQTAIHTEYKRPAYVGAFPLIMGRDKPLHLLYAQHIFL